jgi:hypothetical protein
MVPPLPAGIPILPGQVASGKRARRVPAGLIVVLVLVGLGTLVWFKDWYAAYDGKRIEPVMRQAMLAHATKGSRIPVKLWSGDRLLQIDFATVDYVPRIGLALGYPTTCVSFHVLDPATGVQDPKYQGGSVTCIQGIANRIH